MKNNTLLIPVVCVSILLCQALMGCSDIGSPIDQTVSQLSGSWTWVRSEGGFFPQIITPPQGTIVEDIYLIDGRFYRKRNDTLIVNAHYSISKEGYGSILTYINVNTLPGYQFDQFEQSIQIKGDTLIMSDNGADLFQHTYVRSK